VAAVQERGADAAAAQQREGSAGREAAPACSDGGTGRAPLRCGAKTRKTG
jgi:hypothetical protein